MEGIAFLQTDGESAREAARLAEENVYCTRCRRLVTYARWSIVMNGAHDHTVFNPAGVVFTVLCFREAVGTADFGPPSGEFSWFRGYTWRVVVCAGCGSHLGWRYEGEALPPVFFGLIKDRLSFGGRDEEG